MTRQRSGTSTLISKHDQGMIKLCCLISSIKLSSLEDRVHFATSPAFAYVTMSGLVFGFAHKTSQIKRGTGLEDNAKPVEGLRPVPPWYVRYCHS